MPKIYFFKKYNMANKEVVTVLTVKTEQSQNTIKGLKQEIADLKKKLDTAVIGTDEFEQASRELATAQANLKTVLADGKKTTDAVEGSYNHLTATMAELKKQWKATADEVKRNELGQEIDIINTKLKDMDADIGNFQRNVGDYANQFKEAFEEQQKATQNVRIGLDGLQKTAAGLASGYAAVQGAMNLLNIENSNFEKAMIKVQSAMAIAQGIGGMKDLIEGAGTLKVAFKGATTGVKTFIVGLSGVKKAIAATGIGLLVVAIGTLIAYWDDFISLVKKDSGELNKLENSVKNLKLEMTVKDKDFDYFIKLQEAAGKSRREILKLIEAKKSDDFNKANEVYEAAVDSLQNYKSTFWGDLFGGKADREKAQEIVNEAKEIRDKAYNDWQQASQNIELFDVETETKKEQEAANAAIAAAKDRANKQKEIEEEIRRSRLTEEEKLYDDLDKKYDEYMAVFSGNTEMQLKIFEWYSDEYMKLVDKQLDEEIKAIEENYKKKQELDEKAYADKIAASEKRLGQKFTAIDNSAESATYLNERKKPEGNGEINAIDNELSKLETLKSITEETMKLKIDAIDAEMALFEISSARWVELESMKIQIKQDTTRTLLTLEDQYVEQSKAKNRALAGVISNTFTSSLQSASNIIGALQAGIDTTTKEGFERNKKMQTANAIIQMLVGVTTALSGAFTTKSGPWDWVLAGIQAATIAATGGIQINQIKNTTFDGGGSAGAVATPNINLAESMPIQYTRELLTDSETTNLNKEQRVIVLESDISTVQRKVEVTEANSNF